MITVLTLLSAFRKAHIILAATLGTGWVNAATFAPPTGIFVSSGPTTPSGGHSIQKKDIDTGFVSGVLVRANWSDVEPSRGVYNWDFLDQELALAEQYDTLVTLSVVSGQMAPAWLANTGASMFTYTAWMTGAVQHIPVPWDPIYLDAWTNFIAALGARYNGNPRIVLVHMTNSSQNGFEMQLPPIGIDAQSNWQVLGYSDSLMTQSWQRVIDAFGRAFPNTPLDLDIHPVLNSNRPAIDIMDYASSTLGQQFGGFAGWWSPFNAVSAYPKMYELLTIAAANTFGNVQFYCSETQTPGCFGSDGLSGAVSLALNSGFHYLEIWNQDIENQALSGLWQQTNATLKASNQKPAISAIPAQRINKNTALENLAFTVVDQETAAENLALMAWSSNDSVIQVANITLGGSGANRTVSLTPEANQTGSSLITLIVSDGVQTASASFTVEVDAADNPPAMAGKADLSVDLTSSPSPVAINGQLIYRLEVRNVGSARAKKLTLTDRLPAGSRFVSASPGCKAAQVKKSREKVTCKLKRLDPGLSAVWTIIVQPTAEGAIANSVKVKSKTRDRNKSNNVSTVTTQVLPTLANSR